MSDQEIDLEAILEEIKRKGAVTENTLAKSLQIERPAAHRALVLLLLRGDIVWVPELPRHGVFFKATGVKGFGFPLARHGKAGNITSKVRKRVEEYAETLIEPRTIDQIAEELEFGRDSVRRALHRLEEAGKVESHQWKDLTPGRPTILWGLPGWYTAQDEQEQAKSYHVRRKRKGKSVPVEDDVAELE